jgi:hypothetical protein
MCTFLLSNTPILQFVSLSIITANQSRNNFILAYLLISSASPRLNLASLRLATNELASSAFSKCNQNSGGYRLVAVAALSRKSHISLWSTIIQAYLIVITRLLREVWNEVASGLYIDTCSVRQSFALMVTSHIMPFKLPVRSGPRRCTETAHTPFPVGGVMMRKCNYISLLSTVSYYYLMASAIIAVYANPYHIAVSCHLSHTVFWDLPSAF